MTTRSKLAAVAAHLALAAVFLLLLGGCRGESELDSRANETVADAQEILTSADGLIDRAQEAIREASQDKAAADQALQEAEENGDEQGMRDAEAAGTAATVKGTAASNAQKKAENAKRKADRAKDQAEDEDKTEEDVDNAEENQREAKKLVDKAKAILDGAERIADARKTLGDLGVGKQAIDDLLSQLDEADVKETPDGQPGVNYKRIAGDLLKNSGVDVTGEDGEEKVAKAAQAVEDLFHGEGSVGDGQDAPY